MNERLLIVPSLLICNFTPPHFSYHNINTSVFSIYRVYPETSKKTNEQR